ncbi:hypothetical protein OUZ56_007646 [Daphnia magna]|uniref:Uncharacterized protein n=1 Tax=Daphnia magna TaxID=35525 RepID=A0ABR0AAW2_9CRUS|nr:hypothetical protein OUZ56_007646 [Daphnia magna]
MEICDEDLKKERKTSVITSLAQFLKITQRPALWSKEIDYVSSREPHATLLQQLPTDFLREKKKGHGALTNFLHEFLSSILYKMNKP